MTHWYLKSGASSPTRTPAISTSLTDTVQTFAEYADDETLHLVPGHAYFLDPRPDLPEDTRPARVARRLRLELLPLLRDYLDERLCGGASEAIAGLADRTLVPPAGGAMTLHATSNPTRPRPRATREHTSSETP